MTKPTIRTRVLIRHALCMAVVSVFGVAQADERTDLDTIRGRILQPLLSRRVNIQAVRQLVSSIRPDGSWADIDYQDKTRAEWRTPRHLTRLKTLALAWCSPNSTLRNDPELRRALFAGLNYWLDHDFQNANWWHNVIGVPGMLGPVLLMLDGDLSAGQRAKGIEILRRGKIGMTGQNLVWVAMVTLSRGILEKDSQLVQGAFGRIAEEIRISGEEGIQSDFSFHQHGPCLYNHGYGADFAVDCTSLAGLAAGTRFQFSQSRTDLLAGYILDGSQWMAYGRFEDYGADGREITRPKQTAGYLRTAAENLLKLPTGREKELKALEARIANRTAAPLEGNRCFWRSDFMTHLRSNYYTSARMYSVRVDNTDGPHNGENLKSHYIAEGCNYLFISGREYEDIFPVWDWQKIPGTTIEQTGTFRGSPGRRGTTNFVGGVSDGRYGAAGFDLERDGLRAHKAWFFFDREYVCLGAGIRCASQNAVLTTMNQCYEQGDVTLFGAAGQKRQPKGEHRLTSPLTIHHGDVAYVIPSGAEVVLRNATQRGSWYGISNSLSKDAISREVFSIWIDHGKAPTNAGYAYIVYPGVKRHEAGSCARNSEIAVLSNTSELQAVQNRALRLTQAVFFRAGALRIDAATVVETDSPCVLMLHDCGGTLRLSVADPTQTLKVVRITVSSRLHGQEATYDGVRGISTVSVTLPTGLHAGQSVVRSYGGGERAPSGK